MSPLGCLTLVVLLCGALSLTESGVGAYANKRCQCRKTCSGLNCDTCEEVCCERTLPQGAGLKCCGKQPFNPLTATCCKTRYGKTSIANVTHGLRTEVSACCGLKAMRKLSEICCDYTITAKPVPTAQCCDKVAFDESTHLCCGPSGNKTVVARISTHHQCCGKDQFDTRTQCCCSMGPELQKQPINSPCCCEKGAAQSGLQTNNILRKLYKRSVEGQLCAGLPFNSSTHLCCGPSGNKTVVARISTHHQCCGKDQFDTRTQCCCSMGPELQKQPINSPCCCEKGAVPFNSSTHLCCGPSGNKTVVARISTHHQCCGKDQFDTRTQCCCSMGPELQKQPINSPCCCEKGAGVQQQNCASSSVNQRGNPLTCACGSSTPSKHHCCKGKLRKLWLPCGSGQCDAGPTMCNRCRCCDGCVPQAKLWTDQLVERETPYSSTQHGDLCCDNVLYANGKKGEECSGIIVPYNPPEATMRCHFQGSSRQHRCGTEIFQPHTEICCSGQRHNKVENVSCCGMNSYNIKDPHMKCCLGNLYNLTSLGVKGQDAQCCGSILLTPQDQNVCCSGERQQLLHFPRTGFRCCGHKYYNTSLWSCCAGEMHPINHRGHPHSNNLQESRLLSLNNLKETELCKGIHVGTVESVSSHSVVFSSVLKIHGSTGAVTVVPVHHILQFPDCCNSPRLIPGNTYFFDEAKVFVDFNLSSILQSLLYIFSKCEDP